VEATLAQIQEVAAREFVILRADVVAKLIGDLAKVPVSTVLRMSTIWRLPSAAKAVTTLEKDADVLLTFFDFRAEHWKHVRTSNVIESPFATVRLRQRVTKGAGSRTKGLLMAYKLLDMSQARWRRLDGAHLLPLVRAGIGFVDGVQPEGKASKPKAKAA